MSQYDKLDGQIKAAILAEGEIDFTLLMCNYVGQECSRIANSRNRHHADVLNGRLQALRKRGLIAYSKGKWRLTNEVSNV